MMVEEQIARIDQFATYKDDRSNRSTRNAHNKGDTPAKKPGFIADHDGAHFRLQLKRCQMSTSGCSFDNV